MTKLIPRNTTIPTKKSQVFSTAADNQTQVSIKCLQGEREMAADNKLLGQFDLTGFPPAPRGVPQIEVSFDIDANGIVHVSAKDKATGREQSVIIQSSSGLSDTDVDRLVKEAEKYAAADKTRKETTEARNDADSLIYSTERSLTEHKAKLDAETIAEVEKAMAEAKTAMGKDDLAQLKERVQALQTAAMKIGSKVYASSGGAAGGAGNTNGEGEGEKAKDGKEKEAEFSEKKKD
jgi:molecular chaperone DnaK (HSP70)